MSPSSVCSATGLLLTSKNRDFKMFSKPEVRKVKRVLFGPVDQKATQKFIDEELKKIMVTKSEKWNFDFKTESTLCKHGLFEWQKATPQKDISRVRSDHNQLELDISDQYHGLSEADLIRSKPVKCVPSNNSRGLESSRVHHQSRITDYMKTMKRQSSSGVSSMKQQQPSSEWNHHGPDIPAKIPRLASS
ncbi:hypothetical protein ABEB36_004978 [Hypothenemus hampei]|uniref:Cyclin-dependent kinase inhibitor domain-containing protein n=1 Tax=Hypothenemus hampei TaxID=57062 RepID=A0ABD1EWI2_HYPHA